MQHKQMAQTFGAKNKQVQMQYRLPPSPSQTTQPVPQQQQQRLQQQRNIVPRPAIAQHAKSLLLAQKLCEAAEQKRKGNSQIYEALVHSMKFAQRGELVDVYNGFNTAATRTIDFHADLLTRCIFSADIILDSVLFERSSTEHEKQQSTSDAFISLLLSMANCNAPLCELIIRFCLKNLLPVGDDKINQIKTRLQKAKEETQTTSLEKLVFELDQIKYSNIHKILQELTKTFPICSNLLLQKMKEMVIPSSAMSGRHKALCENYLRIIDYCPSLRFPITKHIVDMAIALDLEIKIVAEDEEPDSYEETQEDQEELFDFLDEKRIDDVHFHTADKLDAIITSLFGYIKRNEGNLPVLNVIFSDVSKIFDERIINTPGLHSVQFIIFYICSLHPDYITQFLDYLLKICLDNKIHPNSRVSAILYLASYLSRANYIPVGVLIKALTVPIKWLQGYINMFSPTLKSVDLSEHKVFYMMCNCIFYVLCYKLKLFMGNKEGISYMVNSKDILNKIVNSKFSPFKILPHDVVEEITKAFHVYQLDELANSLDSKRDVFIPSKTITGDKNWLHIEFFPFDPCLLRASMTFIESIYQRWEIPRHSLQQQVPSDEDTSTTTNSFSYDEGIVIGSPCLRQDRNTMMLSTSFNEEPFFSTHFSSQVKTNHGEEDNHDNHFEEQDDDDDDSRYPEHTQHAGDSSDTDDEETYDGQTFCWADYTVSFSAQSPTSNKQR